MKMILDVDPTVNDWRHEGDATLSDGSTIEGHYVEFYLAYVASFGDVCPMSDDGWFMFPDGVQMREEKLIEACASIDYEIRNGDHVMSDLETIEVDAVDWDADDILEHMGATATP